MKRYATKQTVIYSTLTCSKRRMSFQRICALPTMLDARIDDCSVMFANDTRCGDIIKSLVYKDLI